MNSISAPKISVLIVTYNNEATIGACLDSLSRQTFESFEILVWDNGSIDSTIDVLSRYRNIRHTNSPRNIGFAAAVNRLAEKAQGKYLFILNPDCSCQPNTLENLERFSQSHAGAVSPALVFPNGAVQPSARRFPSIKNYIFSRRSPFGTLGYFDFAKAGFIIPDKPSMVPFVSATALFIEKELFDDVGRFDERFFLYYEDLDLCRRLYERNIPVWYLPDLRVVHLLRASSRKTPIRSLYYHHRALFKYFTKYNRHKYINNIALFFLMVGVFFFSMLIYLTGIRSSHD